MLTKIMEKQPWSWLYAVCFLDLLGASMIMTVSSTHLRSLGMSHVDIGMISSMYGVVQLISGPIVGSWSDVNGRRSILGLSLVLCSAAYGIMGLTSSFYVFLIVRVVLGTFKHTQTLCRAFIADLVPPEKQVSVQGFTNAFTSLSFMIGPVISGHVMEIENGFQYLSRTVLMVFILNASIVYLVADTDSRSEKNPNIRSTFVQKITLVFKELFNMNWRSYWALFCVKFLLALAGNLFFSNIGIILTESFGSTPRYVGYTISFYGFSSSLCNLSAGKIKNLSFFPNSCLESVQYLFFSMAVTFFLLYSIDNYTIFVLGILLLSTIHALIRIFMMEVILEQSDANCRGSMVGASSSVASIARILSPFLSGFLIAWGGVHSALLISCVVSVCACTLTRQCVRQICDKSE